MSHLDKRRFHRYQLRCSVEVSAGAWHEVFETTDLGAGGCRLTLRQPLEEGMSVSVRLRSGRTRREPRGQARVAWTSGSELRAGLAFSDELAEKVSAFLQDLLGPVPIRVDEEEEAPRGARGNV